MRRAAATFTDRACSGLWLVGLVLFGCAGLAGCTGGVTNPAEKGPAERSQVCGTSGPQGVDVSHWQGSIDWSAVAGSGMSFAIASVGDGTYQDPQFAANWSGMQAAGLLRGAYQFFEPGEDATTQANILLSMIGTLGAGDLPPTLDVEVTGGQSPAGICAAVHTWVNVVQGATGRTPILYTGAWFWDPNVQCGDFAGNPLWVSDYSDPCPNLPAAWSGYAIWQNSSTGSVGGIGGGVDTDLFNGSLADLQALAGEGGGTTGGGAGGPSCAGLNDGYYCGSDYVNGDASTLYQCSGGAIAGTQSCSAGCSIQSAGTNDYCNTSVASGPSCAGLNDGYYCGSDYVNGDPGTLYQCAAGGVASSSPCSWGCSVQTNGTNDFCWSPSCAGLNDGDYCGSDYVNGDPNALYTCSGGSVASATACAAGCSVQAAGTNDYCN